MTKERQEKSNLFQDWIHGLLVQANPQDHQ